MSVDKLPLLYIFHIFVFC